MAGIDPQCPSQSSEYLRPGWENAFWPLRPLHPYNDIKTLADAGPWLEEILQYMRDVQYLAGNVGRDYGRATINNLFRLFDELKTRNRPGRPTDLSDFFKVEAAVSDLVYWLRERLLADGSPTGGKPKPGRGSKPKETKNDEQPRSGAEEKIVGALTKWHKYEDGSCLNEEPIKVRELATMAGVGSGSVSRFFAKLFDRQKGGGYHKYKQLCRDKSRLIAWLQLLNREKPASGLLGDFDKEVPAY